MFFIHPLTCDHPHPLFSSFFYMIYLLFMSKINMVPRVRIGWFHVVVSNSIKKGKTTLCVRVPVRAFLLCLGVVYTSVRPTCRHRPADYAVSTVLGTKLGSPFRGPRRAYHRAAFFGSTVVYSIADLVCRDSHLHSSFCSPTPFSLSI